MAGGGELTIGKDLSSHSTAPLIIPLPIAAETAGMSLRENGEAKEVKNKFQLKCWSYHFLQLAEL